MQYLCTLISSELLSYIRSMFGDGLTQQLKIVVAAFYAESVLEDAWILLQKCIDELLAADAPRLIKRRDENNTKMIVDDIIDLFIVLDEKGLIDKLPDYVARNVKRIPTREFWDLYDGKEVRRTGKKMIKIEVSFCWWLDEK